MSDPKVNIPSTHYLVQYKGGGYDGCFWEFNYALIDAPQIKDASRFVDIASSGRYGCTTLDELRQIPDRKSQKEHWVYDLTDPDAVAEFDRESAPEHVFGVAAWLYTHEDYKELAFMPTCDNCGEGIDDEIDMVEYPGLYLCRWHGLDVNGGWGMGGSHIGAGSKVCHECAEEHAVSAWVLPGFREYLADNLPDGALDNLTDEQLKDFLYYGMLRAPDGAWFEYDPDPDHMYIYNSDQVIDVVLASWDYLTGEYLSQAKTAITPGIT